MMTLDPLDVKILSALHANARLTNQELSERVPLSASQCARRRQRLEEAYVIAGYRVLLDRAALGLDVEALVEVVMADHNPDHLADFRRVIDKTPEIVDAWSLTGDADMVLRVALKGLPRLSWLVNDLLLPHPSVARVQSRVVLETLKTAGMPPLLPDGDTENA